MSLFVSYMFLFVSFMFLFVSLCLFKSLLFFGVPPDLHTADLNTETGLVILGT